MKYLRLNPDVHTAGEGAVQVQSHSLRQACAWWVGAELVRRHPDDLFIIETHPGGGQYDCVTVIKRGKQRGPSDLTLLNMNKNLGGHFQTAYETEERFNWLDVLLTTDRRREVVEQIERLHDLPSPTNTPPTTHKSIGPRLISGFLQRTALGPRNWLAENGVADSSAWGSGVRESLFKSVPGMASASKQKLPDDLLGVPGYRFWFLCQMSANVSENHSEGLLPPEFGVDTWTGHIWNGSGQRINLMEMYEKVGRKMDALISAVCPPAF